MTKFAVVRIRGSVDTKKEVLDTLQMLRLTRPNHCSIVEDTQPSRGMLQKVKDVATWGPISPEVLEKLLKKRGRLEGNEPITDEIVDSKTSFNSIGEFATAVCGGDAELSDLSGLKKVFRLRPPRKGYKSVKRPVRDGGSLGFRGEKINDLILRMC